MYLFRLDDASEFMDTENWNKIERLFDMYDIKPLVGVIPNNLDKNFINKYPKNIYFWDKVSEWQNKGWTIALHGYTHVFETEEGGVNPVNKRSEFAGVNLDKQKQKISDGLKVFNNKEI